MNSVRTTRNRLVSILGITGLLIILVLAILLAIRQITGRSLGLRSFVSNQIYFVTSLSSALIDGKNVRSSSHGDYTNIIFLHQSTGRNLLEQGNVRERFQQAGYSFWDHDYNWIGLTDPEGNPKDYSYNVPDDDTYPVGLAKIFDQRVYQSPRNVLSGLLQHEVIAFKSCFPASDINTDEKLEQYKAQYLGIRDVMDQHPDRIFIVMSQPPLNPASTSPEIATRARSFANWLKSNEYQGGHPNVFVFDFFNYLTEDDPTSPDANMLRQEYQQGTDSHPNQMANETIGPLFVDFIIDSIQTYRSE